VESMVTPRFERDVTRRGTSERVALEIVRRAAGRRYGGNAGKVPSGEL
jgi:hypothetical protein